MDPFEDDVRNLGHATNQDKAESSSLHQPLRLTTASTSSTDRADDKLSDADHPINLKLDDPSQLFFSSQDHFHTAQSGPAADEASAGGLNSSAVSHVYTTQEAEESFACRSTQLRGVPLAASLPTCERVSRLDRREANALKAPRRDASRHQLQTEAELESNSTFEDHAFDIPSSGHKRDHRAAYSDAGAASGLRVMPAARTVQGRRARRVAPSHTSREPRPEDFPDQADYQRAWQQWRQVRDANNESVRRSRTGKKGSQHSPHCTNQACLSVYDRLLFLERKHDLLTRALREASTLELAERACFDALFAVDENGARSQRGPSAKQPEASGKDNEQLPLEWTVAGTTSPAAASLLAWSEEPDQLGVVHGQRQHADVSTPTQPVATTNIPIGPQSRVGGSERLLAQQVDPLDWDANIHFGEPGQPGPGNSEQPSHQPAPTAKPNPPSPVPLKAPSISLGRANDKASTRPLALHACDSEQLVAGAAWPGWPSLSSFSGWYPAQRYQPSEDQMSNSAPKATWMPPLFDFPSDMASLDTARRLSAVAPKNTMHSLTAAPQSALSGASLHLQSAPSNTMVAYSPDQPFSPVHHGFSTASQMTQAWSPFMLPPSTPTPWMCQPPLESAFALQSDAEPVTVTRHRPAATMHTQTPIHGNLSAHLACNAHASNGPILSGARTGSKTQQQVQGQPQEHSQYGVDQADTSP